MAKARVRKLRTCEKRDEDAEETANATENASTLDDILKQVIRLVLKIDELQDLVIENELNIQGTETKLADASDIIDEAKGRLSELADDNVQAKHDIESLKKLAEKLRADVKKLNSDKQVS
jgi:chromosome segregation ATPase